MPLRSWGCCGDPTADWPTPRWPAEVLNMFKVSAVPPQRSAILTVFCGATAITDGTTAEPRRSWRCQCGLCRTSTAVAPRLRCDGGISVCASCCTSDGPHIVVQVVRRRDWCVQSSSKLEHNTQPQSSRGPRLKYKEDFLHLLPRLCQLAREPNCTSPEFCSNFTEMGVETEGAVQRDTNICRPIVVFQPLPINHNV